MIANEKTKTLTEFHTTDSSTRLTLALIIEFLYLVERDLSPNHSKKNPELTTAALGGRVAHKVHAHSWRTIGNSWLLRDRKSSFCRYGPWPCPPSSGWPQEHVHLSSTKWTEWVLKEIEVNGCVAKMAQLLHLLFLQMTQIQFQHQHGS